MIDVQGKALYDFFVGSPIDYMLLRNNYGEPEEMPLEVFFRGENDLPELEYYALHLCTGKVLDIGAGAGSHSLILQERGIDVTALEISPLSAQLLKNRGIEKVILEDIYKFKGETFDTLLLLMNGIGLAGDLEGLKTLLNHLSTIISKDGFIICDSSDITYLYEEEGVEWPTDRYFGEIMYRYEYQGEKGNWFKWLYVDQKKFASIAEECGWAFELLFEDDSDQYLAKLYLKN
jgi:SAM-dependent methyltransferase